jgi:hypothetical protein
LEEPSSSWESFLFLLVAVWMGSVKEDKGTKTNNDRL